MVLCKVHHRLARELEADRIGILFLNNKETLWPFPESLFINNLGDPTITPAKSFWLLKRNPFR